MNESTRSYSHQAERLTSLLRLSIAPVAVALADDAPPGVEEFKGQVPSSCALWREAEQGLFFAAGPVHHNCAVGAHVMGFAGDDEVKSDLMEAIGLMGQCGYFSEDEAAAVPTLAGHGRAGMLYGPLEDFPVTPDLVLMWVSPADAMLVSETAGTAQWGSDAGARVFGRPGCTALPLASQDGRPVLSFGCTGMRTFTRITDDRGLAVIPGQALDAFVQRLEAVLRANRSMQLYYEQRRDEFATV